MQWRIIEEKLFIWLMRLATAIVVGSLFFIVLIILGKGLPTMNLEMITQTPKGGFYLGKSGGILNAIIGSTYLAIGATVLAFCISVPLVIYLNIYAKKNSGMPRIIRFILDVLWGIPSIVYGTFGFTLLLFLGMRASLIGGIITVGILIVPVMSRAMDESFSMIPKELFHASYSLGATRFETAMKVALRQTTPGIVTAVLIAFGRAIGDAASVLFTAGFTDRIPTALTDPVATLPLAIFFQLGSPIPEVQERAYASTFILTLLILVISLLTRWVSARFGRHKIN